MRVVMTGGNTFKVLDWERGENRIEFTEADNLSEEEKKIVSGEAAPRGEGPSPVKLGKPTATPQSPSSTGIVETSPRPPSVSGGSGSPSQPALTGGRGKFGGAFGAAAVAPVDPEVTPGYVPYSGGQTIPAQATAIPWSGGRNVVQAAPGGTPGFIPDPSGGGGVDQSAPTAADRADAAGRASARSGLSAVTETQPAQQTPPPSGGYVPAGPGAGGGGYKSAVPFSDAQLAADAAADPNRAALLRMERRLAAIEEDRIKLQEALQGGSQAPLQQLAAVDAYIASGVSRDLHQLPVDVAIGAQAARKAGASAADAVLTGAANAANNAGAYIQYNVTPATSPNYRGAEWGDWAPEPVESVLQTWDDYGQQMQRDSDLRKAQGNRNQMFPVEAGMRTGIVPQPGWVAPVHVPTVSTATQEAVQAFDQVQAQRQAAQGYMPWVEVPSAPPASAYARQSAASPVPATSVAVQTPAQVSIRPSGEVALPALPTGVTAQQMVDSGQAQLTGTANPTVIQLQPITGQAILDSQQGMIPEVINMPQYILPSASGTGTSFRNGQLVSETPSYAGAPGGMTTQGWLDYLNR